MTPTVDILKRSRSPEEFWFDVYINGELKHEHLDAVELEALGLQQTPSYRLRRVK